ncbi:MULTISPECIES: metallophosphoesterase [Asticcacaulis]|uniref:metallophosphoesterase family protein n=1 Tax=Asticcacaulis TaxID=76890 RepID=UPI001AEB50F1|nr:MULTISPECIES: metallophosphoesterase [Asticcacaulis]MBP2159930.1 3',5'-cyclic AMP phosphodiesterase CpdA [Asticcacaulis solisilvae]MDR6800975.1 3',5'-cyclic AMP phosphodiesterase CpdA [Asticcacaulis sp. BE141]
MKIAHISDLHFGCEIDWVRDELRRTIEDAGVDLVIASGDITQSATVEEFRAARDWLHGLTAPVFVIPGNHDLPGMDLTRFLTPWKRYKEYLGHDLEPEMTFDLVHVKGINTARRILPHWNWANGMISQRQCREVGRSFEASNAPWRIFVMHHPVMNSRDFPLDVSLFNAHCMLGVLAEQKVDLVLAGHQHHAYIENRVVNGHTTLFLNASTAMSARIRRQPNGFNMLTFNDKSVRIDRMELCDKAFKVFSAETHTKA